MNCNYPRKAWYIPDPTESDNAYTFNFEAFVFVHGFTKRGPTEELTAIIEHYEGDVEEVPIRYIRFLYNPEHKISFFKHLLNYFK